MRELQCLVRKLNWDELCWACRNCTKRSDPLTCRFHISYQEGFTWYMPAYCAHFQLHPGFLQTQVQRYLILLRNRCLRWGWKTYSLEERRAKGTLPWTIKFDPSLVARWEKTYGEFPPELWELDGKRYVDATGANLSPPKEDPGKPSSKTKHRSNNQGGHFLNSD